MGESVIFPSMTDQMVLGVFKYLVDAELRKNLGSQHEFRFGCQEGMIAALVLMFGESDDLTSETAFDQGKTWLHHVGEIMHDLQDWVAELAGSQDLTSINWDALKEAVSAAVDNYALKHPKAMGDALRLNL